MNGFEFRGDFYALSVTDHAKDLMLIDRFSAMPFDEFFEAASDGYEATRGPIVLTLIATSIRAGHPDWSVEKITRLVMNLSLSDVAFGQNDELDDDVEEGEQDPPAEATAESTGNGSGSLSKSTSSAPDPEPSETSSEIPA